MANTPPATPRPRAGQALTPPTAVTRPTALRPQTGPRPLTMETRYLVAAAEVLTHNAKQDANPYIPPAGQARPRSPPPTDSTGAAGPPPVKRQSRIANQAAGSRPQGRCLFLQHPP